MLARLCAWCSCPRASSAAKSSPFATTTAGQAFTSTPEQEGAHVDSGRTPGLAWQPCELLRADFQQRSRAAESRVGCVSAAAATDWQRRVEEEAAAGSSQPTAAASVATSAISADANTSAPAVASAATPPLLVQFRVPPYAHMFRSPLGQHSTYGRPDLSFSLYEDDARHRRGGNEGQHLPTHCLGAAVAGGPAECAHTGGADARHALQTLRAAYSSTTRSRSGQRQGTDVVA